MVMENKQSLEVDYQLLAKECHALAYFLPEVPTQVGFDYNQFLVFASYSSRIESKPNKGP